MLLIPPSVCLSENGRYEQGNRTKAVVVLCIVRTRGEERSLTRVKEYK